MSTWKISQKTPKYLYMIRTTSSERRPAKLAAKTVDGKFIVTCDCRVWLRVVCTVDGYFQIISSRLPLLAILSRHVHTWFVYNQSVWTSPYPVCPSVCPCVCATLSHATATYHCNRLSKEKEKKKEKQQQHTLMILPFCIDGGNKSCTMCVCMYEWMCHGYYIYTESDSPFLPPYIYIYKQFEQNRISSECCIPRTANSLFLKKRREIQTRKVKVLPLLLLLLLIAINLVIVSYPDL